MVMPQRPHGERRTPARPVVIAGRFDTVRDGLPRHPFHDFYVWLLRASWSRALGVLGVAYVALNLLFGSAFWLVSLWLGPCFAVPDPTFLDAFWFSVQTFATIGYGVMSPTTAPAHLLVTIEAFVGILYSGMATGLMFARFSKPTARVGFARNVVVVNRNGIPTLQIRMANERSSEILSASAQVFVLIDEQSPEGQRMRRFHPVKLERDTSPLFALSWTLIHAIDETSRFHGITAENVGERMVGMAVNVTGIDDSFGQAVHARQVYRAEDLVFGRQFADMITPLEGAIHIDHRKLSDLVDAP